MVSVVIRKFQWKQTECGTIRQTLIGQNCRLSIVPFLKRSIKNLYRIFKDEYSQNYRLSLSNLQVRGSKKITKYEQLQGFEPFK